MEKIHPLCLQRLAGRRFFCPIYLQSFSPELGKGGFVMDDREKIQEVSFFYPSSQGDL